MNLLLKFQQFIKGNTKFLEVMFLFLLSLTPFLWLKDGQIILGHDSGFRLDPLKYLINLFYSWDPSSNFGQESSLYKGFLITQFPEAFFMILTKSLTTAQELTFVLWFFVMGFSMYIFINTFFSERKFWIFRIFGSSLYMFNFFILQGWFIVERAKFSIFAVLPLGIMILYKTLTKEYSILKGAILFSLLSFFLNGGGNPTFYASLILAYGITFIYLLVLSIHRNGRKELLYFFKLGFILLICFWAINAYFILPQLYLFLKNYGSTLTLVGGVTGILEWESVISKNASLINLFRLQGIPDWGNNFHVYSSLFTKNPFLTTFSFIFPLILFFGLLNHNKLTDGSKNKIFFLILIFVVVGFPFTAGSHPPFGFIYTFFVKHLPGFAIFRSAFYKFGELLWFSYIFLVSFYLNFFFLKYIKKKKLYVLLGIISILFILVYHFPFFKVNFFLWNKPFTTRVTLPAYVTEMSSYVNQLPSQTRFLMLPEIDSRSADSYSWGFWSLDMLPRLFTDKSVISIQTDDSKNIKNLLSQSLYQNDEKLFLKLASIMGINKILWRDDILYSDKKTKQNAFLREKNNLDNFDGIILEKKIGAWSLYSISSHDSSRLFYIADDFIYFYSKNDLLGNFLDEGTFQSRSALMLDRNSSPQGLTALSSLYNHQIIEADCILCKPFELEEFKQKIKVPTVKFLPSSLFYAFVSNKEKKEKELFKNDTLLSIYVNIAHANRRLGEILQIAVRNFNKENSEELMIEQIEEYRSLISNALDKSNYLSQDKENEALIQLLSYLEVQYKSLSMINNKYRSAEEELEDISNFMLKNISVLKNKIWMTSPNRDRFSYLINLQTEGNYDLAIKSSSVPPLKVEVDGKKITNLNNNYFSSGMHQLSLTYPFENLLKNDSKQEEFTLDFDESAKFGIKNFRDKDVYLISFDYRVAYGKPKFSMIEDGKTDEKKIVKMGGSNKWSRFSYIYRPTDGTRTPTLKLSPFSYEMEGTSLKLKNFTIIKSFTPSLLLLRNISEQKKNNPKIYYERIDPTKFIVRVEGASDPFVLSFGEYFNRGWKASISNGNPSIFSLESFPSISFFNKNLSAIPEINHFEINGYGNGWLVEKKGNYNIIVEYYPQKFFYLGLAVSIITLSLFFGLFFYKKYEKNK